MPTRCSCPPDARCLLRGIGSLSLGLIPLAVLGLFVLAGPKVGLSPAPRTDQCLAPFDTACGAPACDECSDGLALPPPRSSLDPVRIHTARRQGAYVMSLKVRLRGARWSKESRSLQNSLKSSQDGYRIAYLLVTPQGRRSLPLPDSE